VWLWLSSLLGPELLQRHGCSPSRLPRRGETLTYGELRIAAYEATGMKVCHNSFGRLALEANKKSDGCLLSSIIVQASTGRLVDLAGTIDAVDCDAAVNGAPSDGRQPT